MTAEEISTSFTTEPAHSRALEDICCYPSHNTVLFQATSASVTQFHPAEVSKAEVPAARSTVPSVGLSSVSISFPPEPSCSRSPPFREAARAKEGVQLQLVGDAIDLRTVPKADVSTENVVIFCLCSGYEVADFTASEMYGRQISVQPSIINLSATSSSDSYPWLQRQ